MSLFAKICAIGAHRNPWRPDSLNLELQEAVDHVIDAVTLLKSDGSVQGPEECMVYTLAGFQPAQGVSLCLVTGRCGCSRYGREEHNRKAKRWRETLSWTVLARHRLEKTPLG